MLSWSRWKFSLAKFDSAVTRYIDKVQKDAFSRSLQRMGIPWTSLRLTIQGIAGLQLWSKAIEPYWGAKWLNPAFVAVSCPAFALVPLSSLLYHRVAKPGRQMTRHHIAQAAYETELMPCTSLQDWVLAKQWRHWAMVLLKAICHDAGLGIFGAWVMLFHETMEKDW